MLLDDTKDTFSIQFNVEQMMKEKGLFHITKQFPAMVWVLIIGVFFSRGTFYMVWPFLAILLYQNFGLNEWEIGLVLTGSALSAVIVGFYSGALTDKVGRKLMLVSAGILSMIAFALMASVNTITGYVVAIALCSISKEIWEPPAKALISDLLPDTTARDYAFQLRYWVVNVGAAVGPLAGVWLGLTAQQSTFNMTAGIFFVLTIAVMYTFKHTAYQATQQHVNTASLRQTCRILLQDHVFLLLILANIIVMFIYSHVDTSLVQYLSREGVPEVIELISVLLFTNAITIIVFQFILMRLMAGWTLNQRIYSGMGLLTLSQLVFALNPIDWYAGWIIAVFILALGESILFPNMNIQIDRIAPPHMKGVYFGAAAFYSIGFAIGPYIGGVILSFLSGPILYGFTFVLGLAVFGLYHLINSAKRPVFDNLATESINGEADLQ
ncbi:MDR family MFS transporter [Flocculibacter collagenilyticus]|uniref:MDR family MFS transporter n=1 Tax=Flocculibacter collagenilyticus TaxID=2744479 RepID=UPI0018F5F291|nr:MFS transporter [Flocculibacter collagenilyticus]